MRFFLDHDVPVEIARILQLRGHNAEMLEDVLPETCSDFDALQYAATQKRIMVTCNRRDFLRLACLEPHAGLIILVRRHSRVAECAALVQLLDRAGLEGMSDNINFA